MESKTQIVVTIGPSSESKDVLLKLIEAGMNIARLNFSWGNHEYHLQLINNIREAAKEKGVEIPIIQDLSGPREQDENGHHFGGEKNNKVITDKDISDLSFGIDQNIEYIALSFVGDADDVVELRNLINEKGGNQKIIAKIERKEAFNNLDSILDYTDGVMVARGDLGNEYPLEEIPLVQHHILRKSKLKDKMVIVATQMMLSMVDSPTPSRAEVSDVTYAILDGASAVMLSEESARGKYPVEAVTYMEKIALASEKHKYEYKIN